MEQEDSCSTLSLNVRTHAAAGAHWGPPAICPVRQRRGVYGDNAVSLLGHAQLLGRAEDPRQFVRHGKKEGYTEITLSGGAGERPVKVYHLIRSEGERASEWKLNGELCPWPEGLAESVKVCCMFTVSAIAWHMRDTCQNHEQAGSRTL